MNGAEDLFVTAPGKVMFAGEYAVLRGGEAILVTVDRRARASVGTGNSELLDALNRVFLQRGMENAASRLGKLGVDTRSFYEPSGEKLGIGSSAAAVVAATGFSLWQGENPGLDEVLEVARQAHGDFQADKGARGSGVDVVASAVGGALAAKASGEYERLTLPEEFCWRLVWTGRAASSPNLVSQVNTFVEANGAEAERLFTDLADVATQFRNACEKDSAAHAVGALDSGALALAALGQAAEVGIELPIHKELREKASRFGGTAKPVGAGGGDVCLCAFASQSDLEKFTGSVADGVSFLSLDQEPKGVLWSDEAS